MSEVKRYKLDVDGQHVAANRRILLEDAVAASDYDALAAQNAELLSALIDMTERHALTVTENGGCDHSVGICWCDDIRALDAARAAIAKATPTPTGEA